MSPRALLVVAVSWSLSAHATYNATVIGTIASLTQFGTALQFSPETAMFDPSNQPILFSPNSITDAQTRRNMLAILLHAKATGGKVEIAHDNTGTYCDQGYPAVYYIVERP
jgi:hypothetical protein